jgi:hypothetical protein
MWEVVSGADINWEQYTSRNLKAWNLRKTEKSSSETSLHVWKIARFIAQISTITAIKIWKRAYIIRRILNCPWKRAVITCAISCMRGERWPPLWSSSQSSWLQIRRPGFNSRHYQIFWEKKKKKKKVVGLERGPLSLVSTTEELLDRKVATPVYKTENTAIGIRHADHVAPSIRKSW